MMSLRQKTHIVKTDDIERDWFVVDAEGETLGRLASEVAKVLRGKHKATYTPHLDLGDYVVVVNASKIAVSGNKMDDKIYYRHTGYPGGIRLMTLREQLARHPTFAVKAAIRGMLPKNRLGRRMLRKLKVYAGPDHPHRAQQPKPLEF
jgi:large subunit ribosomal protein L13